MPVTLHNLLQAHYGVKTSVEVNPLVSNCGNTVTKLVSQNPNRLGLVITNSGGNHIYLSPKNTVAVGSGQVLVPTGGSISFTWLEDFDLVANEFFGIATGAGSNVNVLEVVSL